MPSGPTGSSGSSSRPGPITSLITLYALTRFWNMAFWRRRDELEGYESVLLGSVQEAPEGATVTATRTTPVLMMVAATTALVDRHRAASRSSPARCSSSPDRAADEAQRPRSVYVSLVFPGGIR